MKCGARYHQSIAILVGLVISAASAGCASSDGSLEVTPNVEVINRTHSALAAGSITHVNGTYAGTCDGRSVDGTETWTLALSGVGTTLSVRKNDADCVLAVTEVEAGTTYLAVPEITLETAWQATASEFAEAMGPLAFYGNAKISSDTFANDFTLSLLVSDDPSASDNGSRGASFATQEGSVESTTVAASDYSISFAQFQIEKDVDNIVQSVSGFAQLTAGTIAGQDYAIYHGALTDTSTFEDVVNAWAGASVTAALSSLTSLQIPADQFGLLEPAVDLDDNPERTVIVRNRSEGVDSYQLHLITFTP